MHDMKLGDAPQVPPEVPKGRTALEVALAAIERLAAMRRPRSRVLYRHRRPGEEGAGSAADR
jgi:hypothetical protein